MKVAVIGGKLQGIEAAYLARKAGWNVALIDRDPDVPARELAHSFIQLDVTMNTTDIWNICKDMDLIIPALENYEALVSLKDLAKSKRLPLAFDDAAYAITSSKQESNSLFKDLGLPAPRPWPDCGFPVILKPSGSSGSQGVIKITDNEQLTACRHGKTSPDDWIIQEFLEGPSYSLEVVGIDGHYRSLQCTIIEVDGSFDCKRVIAPSDLTEAIEQRFDEMALSVAKAINLRGIMDLEVILHKNELKILEIDARLPSQTPTAVLKSTGINMLELLYDIFNRRNKPDILPAEEQKPVIYEHIKVNYDTLEICGEHIISEARQLRYKRNFFGADEALTDFDPDYSSWVATLILTGRTKKDALRKHHLVLETICRTFGLRECSDEHPILQ